MNQGTRKYLYPGKNSAISNFVTATSATDSAYGHPSDFAVIINPIF